MALPTKPSDIRPRGQKLILSFDEFQREPTQASQRVGGFEGFRRDKEKQSLAFDPGTDYPLAPGLMPIGPSGVTTGKPYKPPTGEFRPDNVPSYVEDRTKESYDSAALEEIEKSLSGDEKSAMDFTSARFAEKDQGSQYMLLMLNELGPRARFGKMRQNIVSQLGLHRGDWLLRHVFGKKPGSEVTLKKPGDDNQDPYAVAKLNQHYFDLSWEDYLRKGLTTPASEFYADDEALIRGYKKALEVSARVTEGGLGDTGDYENVQWEQILNHILFTPNNEINSEEQNAIIQGMARLKRRSPILEMWKEEFDLKQGITDESMDFLNYIASKKGSPLYMPPEDRFVGDQSETEVRPPAAPQVAPPVPAPAPAGAPPLPGPPMGRPPAEGIAAMPGMEMQPLGPRAVSSRRKYSPSYKGRRKPLDQWVGSGYQPLPPGPSGLAFPHRQPWI